MATCKKKITKKKISFPTYLPSFLGPYPLNLSYYFFWPNNNNNNNDDNNDNNNDNNNNYNNDDV